jgi:hypothetical protein
MKTNNSLMKTVLVAALLAAAVPLMADEGSSGAVPPHADPAGAGATKSPEPKIEGFVIQRAKGGYLGLAIENNNFKLTFYDDKKLPVAADVSSALLRWPVNYSKADERAILMPTGDGMALTSPKDIRPPHTFRLYMTLIVDGSDQQPESYVLDYHE